MNSRNSRRAKRYFQKIQTLILALCMITALYAVGYVDGEVHQAETLAYKHR